MKRTLALAVLVLLAHAQTLDDMKEPLDEARIATQGSRIQADASAGSAENPWKWLDDTWTWTGNILSQACRFTQGTPIDLNQVLNLGFPVPVPASIRPIPELEWICEAAYLYRTVNGIVRQNWAQVAGEIAGTWIGDIATAYLGAIGIEAGSAQWAGAIQNLNMRLKDNYRSFMAATRNLMWNAVKKELEERRAQKYGATKTATTPQDVYRQKVEQTVEQVAPMDYVRALDTLSKNAEKEKVAQAVGAVATSQKLAEEYKKNSTEWFPKQAGKHEDTVVGNQVVNKGILTQLKEEAQTAPSSREVLEVINKAILESIRVQLYSTSAVLKALNGILDMQTTTNQVLLSQMRQAGAEAASLEGQIREEITNAGLELAQVNYATHILKGAYEGLLEGIATTE